MRGKLARTVLRGRGDGNAAPLPDAELGCQVRNSEKSTPVVFYKSYDVTPETENFEDDGKRRVARASAVFNCVQVDGYHEPAAVPDLGPVARNQVFDDFVAATGAAVYHGGNRAFYRPSTDTITMPDETRFCGTTTMTRNEAYISVLAHELGHYAAYRIMPRVREFCREWQLC